MRISFLLNAVNNKKQKNFKIESSKLIESIHCNVNHVIDRKDKDIFTHTIDVAI